MLEDEEQRTDSLSKALDYFHGLSYSFQVATRILPKCSLQYAVVAEDEQEQGTGSMLTPHTC